MARLFTAASSQALVTSSLPFSGIPVTIALWWRPASSAYGILFSATNGGATQFFEIYDYFGEFGSQNQSAGVYPESSTAAATTPGTWIHGCSVTASSTSHTFYANGTAATTDTTSASPTGMDKIAIGARGQAVESLFADGSIAEVGIWNVALAAREISSLAAGVPPSMVRPESLVQYIPVYGEDSPEFDASSGNRDMTLVGTPTKTSHPPTQPFLYVPQSWSVAQSVPPAPAPTLYVISSPLRW